jgi:hypothetical protein
MPSLAPFGQAVSENIEKFNSWSLLSLSAILQVQNAYYDYHTVYIMTTHLSGVQHDFHVTLCSCCPTVTGQVSLVEQELLIIPV